MVRFLLLNSFIAVHSIFLSLFALLISIFDRDGGNKVHRYVAVPWAKMILWVCGVKVLVLGKENLNPEVPRIYLSNHQSYFDIFVLLAHLPVNFKFVLKKELMRLPVFGISMRKAGYIGIDRDDPRKALQGMKEAAERIKAGASVLVFPEGTRSPDGVLQPFKPGAFHIALKSQCDVVPLAITGSRFIVPKGSLRVQRGTITLHLGRPIPFRSHSKKDMPILMEQVREAMLRLMETGKE